MSKPSNSPDARLRRIETRLTNFGRWMGVDLTLPPVNEPDQPVFIDDCVVYATPSCSVGDMLLAVRRYRAPAETDELPLVVNGREVGVVTTYCIDAGERDHEVETDNAD